VSTQIAKAKKLNAVEWTSEFLIKHPIHFWEGCDLRLADGIARFKDEIVTRTKAARLSASSVKLIAAESVVPLFDLILKEQFGTHVLGEWSQVNRKRIIENLDFLLKHIALLKFPANPDELLALIDTMREIAHFIASWSETKLETVPEELTLKAPKKRLRNTESLNQKPYCQLCWRLTEAAALKERDLDADHSKRVPGSKTHCAIHTHTSSEYQNAHDDQKRFRVYTKAIYRKMALCPNYRELFACSTDELAWKNGSKVIIAASRSINAVSLLQMRVRYVASEIVRNYEDHEIDKAIEIAELQQSSVDSSGKKLTLKALSEQLGFSTTVIDDRRKMAWTKGNKTFNKTAYFDFGSAANAIKKELQSHCNSSEEGTSDDWLQKRHKLEALNRLRLWPFDYDKAKLQGYLRLNSTNAKAIDWRLTPVNYLIEKVYGIESKYWQEVLRISQL
jgi:hypothetical protein